MDWTRFSLRIPIEAPADAILSSWTRQAELERWFLRLAEFRRPDGTLVDRHAAATAGDTYVWRWHGWPDEVEERGVVLPAEAPYQFSFSFGKAGNCHLRVLREKDATILQLDQTDIPDTEEGRAHWHIGCRSGWIFYLANLKSILEGGLDLRNRDPDLTAVINS